eukprot:m51a1_g3003 hypothetical protein (2207) ;mRNA; r:787285-800952
MSNSGRTEGGDKAAEQARSAWSKALDTLRSSRDSILGATAAANAVAAATPLSHPGLVSEIMDALAPADDRKKVALLYLVDSLCQYENKRGLREWRTATFAFISGGGFREQVLEIWQQRKVFSGDSVRALVKLARQRLPPEQRRPEDDFAREIETVRRESKKARFEEKAARAGNQFEEMWREVEAEERPDPKSNVSQATSAASPSSSSSPSMRDGNGSRGGGSPSPYSPGSGFSGMGNTAGKRRDVRVSVSLTDTWAEIAYDETLTNQLDCAVFLLLELPLGNAVSGAQLLSFEVEVAGEGAQRRTARSTVRERPARALSLSGGDAVDETLLVELGEMPAHGTARLHATAVSLVRHVAGREREFVLPLARCSLGEADTAEVSVVCAETSDAVASVSCPSHPDARVGPAGVDWAKAPDPDDGAGVVECGDMAVTVTASEQVGASFVVERAPDGSLAAMLFAPIDPALAVVGRLEWPAELRKMRMVPDSLRELIGGTSFTPIFAFIGQEIDPQSEASLVAVVGGQRMVFKSTPRFIEGTVLHALAAQRAIHYLVSNGSADTKQKRGSDGQWSICALRQPTQAELNAHMTSLGTRYGVEGPLTSFYVEESGGTGRNSPRTMACRHNGSQAPVDGVRRSSSPIGERLWNARRSTLAINERAGVLQAVRKELVRQGKRSTAEHIVDVEGRVMKTRKLDVSMVFAGETGLPSIALLRQHFVNEGRLAIPAALDLISKATELCRNESNVVHVEVPLHVVGDLHGQFYDLLEIFKAVGLPTRMVKFVFLGDYVDRGWFSTEVMLFLCALKIVCPSSVTLLRGNHESRIIGQSMTFEDECLEKYDDSVFDAFQLLFESLPLAALIKGTPSGTCLCVHGGIGPSIRKIKDIEKIDRFREIPNSGAFNDLVWSDPVGEWKEFPRLSLLQWESLDFSVNKTRKAGQLFGPKAAHKFLSDNKLCCLIRGHQVFKNGYMEHFGREEQNISPVVTVFSAPNYAEKYGNKGAYLSLTRDSFKMCQFDEVPHPYNLPYYCDGLTYTLPLLCERIEEIIHALMMMKDSTQTEEERKADEALTEKIKQHDIKAKRAQEQRAQFLQVSHKNMKLFERVLAEDAGAAREPSYVLVRFSDAVDKRFEAVSALETAGIFSDLIITFTKGRPSSALLAFVSQLEAQQAVVAGARGDVRSIGVVGGPKHRVAVCSTCSRVFCSAESFGEHSTVAESSTSKALKRSFKEVVLSWSMIDVHNEELYAETVERIPLRFDSSHKQYHELMYWPLVEDLREVVSSALGIETGEWITLSSPSVEYGRNWARITFEMDPDGATEEPSLFPNDVLLLRKDGDRINKALAYVDTMKKKTSKDDKSVVEKPIEGSFENIYEVACVSFLLDQISKAPGDPSVAVIAPYKRQKERLEIHCRDKHFRCKPSVGTVDSFQGKEYDVVILSATRANSKGRVGFLNEQRRLNVALTRARSSMIVVCSVSTLKLSAERAWVDMIMDAEARSRVFAGPTVIDMRLKVELLLEDMQLAPLGSNIWSTRIDEQGRQSLIHLGPQERLSVFNCINRITQGRWTESEIRSQRAAKDSPLKCGIHVVWTVEVDERKRTQVVKVITAVKGTDVAAFIKTANLALGRRRQEHASLCETDNPTNGIVSPLFWSESQWMSHKELVALPAMTKGAVQPARSKDEEEIGKILLQKSYEYNGNFVRALMQVGPRRGQEIPFLLSEEETEIAARSDSTFVLGRSGTGKTTILLMRIIATALFLTAGSGLCARIAESYRGMLEYVEVEDYLGAWKNSDESYWPRFDSNLKNGLRPSQVWTEIVSVIKGSVQSLRNVTGFLTQEQYLEQVARRRTSSTVPTELAPAVYSLFERYQKMKTLLKEHDCLDIVAYLFRSLEAMDPQPQWLPAFDNVYLDEAQDLCPAQLVLLSFLCRNPKGYVCVGDTAQTIAKGSSFRFEDLKEIFYVSVLGRDASAVPKVDQLTKNYRSHSGIVSLANSITQICSRFYPQMIDSLKQEESATMGPKPIAVRESKQAHSLVEALCGCASQKEGHTLEIGARLAIIVRNDAKKNAIQERMPSANILTVFESKGLEFEHVLVVDFFADSDADPGLWRAAYSWMKALGYSAADFFSTVAESAQYSSLYCEDCCGVVLELREEKERLTTLPSYASSGGEREQTLEAASSVDDLLSDLELDNSKHKSLDVAWLASQLEKAGRVLAESRTHTQ